MEVSSHSHTHASEWCSTFVQKAASSISKNGKHDVVLMSFDISLMCTCMCMIHHSYSHFKKNTHLNTNLLTTYTHTNTRIGLNGEIQSPLRWAIHEGKHTYMHIHILTYSQHTHTQIPGLISTARSRALFAGPSTKANIHTCTYTYWLTHNIHTHIYQDWSQRRDPEPSSLGHRRRQTRHRSLYYSGSHCHTRWSRSVLLWKGNFVADPSWNRENSV
jgi:hypothetical protein